MQDFNTIIGVIQMRQNDCSFSVIQKRYHIGSGTTQRILSRFEASGLTLEELRSADPHAVDEYYGAAEPPVVSVKPSAYSKIKNAVVQ